MLRMGNVNYDGSLNLEDIKHVELSDSDNKKYQLLEGDILFNRTNSKELVGKTGLWDGRFPAVSASYFIRLRVDRKQVEPSYVWAFMNSHHMKRRLFETARGAIGQSNINATELQAFSIPLPPIEIQQEFTARLNQIRSIQSQATRALVTAEATFQALLHRAFAGEL